MKAKHGRHEFGWGVQAPVRPIAGLFLTWSNINRNLDFSWVCGGPPSNLSYGILFYERTHWPEATPGPNCDKLLGKLIGWNALILFSFFAFFLAGVFERLEIICMG